eukprot:Pompholyxophrys_punicea_v1_NODE_416_length_2017_cov_2.186544.p2 type:complete len:166 gc:universal NODE_416_length_2017_cov_2.186544:1247-750(-)
MVLIKETYLSSWMLDPDGLKQYCQGVGMPKVKKILGSIFSRFGIPEVAVPDNAPEFVTLKSFLESMGCRLLHSPTYHPQSNGIAERAVQTVKSALRNWSPKMGDLQARILFNHRSSAGHAGCSPARRLLGRDLRTALNPQFRMDEKVFYRSAAMVMATPRHVYYS